MCDLGAGLRAATDDFAKPVRIPFGPAHARGAVAFGRRVMVGGGTGLLGGAGHLVALLFEFFECRVRPVEETSVFVSFVKRHGIERRASGREGVRHLPYFLVGTVDGSNEPDVL